jgi:hypothetical protein
VVLDGAQQRKDRMIVSHRHRFIFMKTLKTGGTSVEIALSRICGPDDVITPLPGADERLRRESGGLSPQNFESPPLPLKLHEHIWAMNAERALGPEVWDSYLRFAVVRNPWDAVVSLYFWVTRHGAEREPFESFLQWPQVVRLARRNHGITHVQKRPVVQRYLRFETLADDLDAVWRELGLPGDPELPRAKGGVRPAAAAYRSFYTDESAALVGRLFAATIAQHGYTF